MMTLEALRDDLSDEISTILNRQFSITVTSTDVVPHSRDPAITFPNLDTDTQGAKLITTCVLYIDMRRSTDLSFAHKPQTVAKLYSAFIRSMTRTARYYSGHVRGIVGDRVMVLFDVRDCFKNAVRCAIAMNTISNHVINKHFKANEVKFGIGIDYGKMLATKTGIRKHGHEQGNYQNLVWLGRPANVASKLTDAANKAAEYTDTPIVNVAYSAPSFGLFGSGLGLGALNISNNPLQNAVQPVPPNGWTWTMQTPSEFLSNLEVHYSPKYWTHKEQNVECFYVTTATKKIKDETPSILMTSVVWDGFKKVEPNSESVRKALFKKVAVTFSGYQGLVYGGNVIYPSLCP